MNPRQQHAAPPSLLLALLLLATMPAAAAAGAAAGSWRLVGPAEANVGAVALPPSPLGALYTSSPTDAIFSRADEGATATGFGFPADPCPFSSTPLLASDPSPAGTLYATDRKSVWKSLDRGGTWQPTTSPQIGWLADLAVLPDAPGHLLAVADGSIFPALSPPPPCYPRQSGSGVALSDDGGLTWNVVRPAGSASYQAAAFDPAHVERLYLGTAAGDLFLSEDGGTTLKSLDFPLRNEGVYEIRIDATTVPSTLFALSGGQLYRTPLAADGSSGPWSRLAQAPVIQVPAPSHRTLLLDPSRPGTLYTFTFGGVFVSTDRGDSWSSLTGGITGGLDPSGVTGLALDPRPSGPLYAATRHGLYALDRSGCAENTAGVCLSSFRFRVAVSFATSGGPATAAHAQALSADTADLWFFAPGNLELVVKVLDGRAVNGAFWVFAGGLSDVAYTLTVTDTATGAVKSYPKAAGSLSSFADTSAFPASSASPESTTRAARTADLPLAPAPFLLPDALPDAAGCAPGSTALCLSSARFRVAVAYQAGSLAGDGRTLPLTGDTGAFWFFSPENVELIVKVLDGRGVNGHFWVFYGALSNVAYTVTVTDTVTGAVRTYTNPQGRLASFADTSAF